MSFTHRTAGDGVCAASRARARGALGLSLGELRRSILHRTAVQAAIAWTAAKSVTPSRIAQNIAVFDFELTADQLAAIDTLDTGIRGGPDPESVTLETFGREIPEA